jgi:Domain of unknown function (DUF4832)/Domain of unknown function (DUF4874)/Secretion system C-terminal sorting domain
MKKYFLLLFFSLFTLSIAQTTVNYSPSNAEISNPERGLYKYSETFLPNYSFLDQTTLTNYRVNSNITLIYRLFHLDNFKTTPVSQAYLDNIQTDFNTLRKAGLKAIVRFSYSDKITDVPRDASKAIILAHIAQLKPILSANTDVIALMQAGFIGTYGEWYYTSQAEFGGYGYNNTALTTQNNQNRKEVVDAILNALPANRMVQLRTPAYKRDLYGTTALTNAQAFTQIPIARIGQHNDCFLASSTDQGTYTNTTLEYPYLEQESKFLPVGGETCALNLPRSGCVSALTEMARFHWSYLNVDYNLDVIADWTTTNCFADIKNKLGYRFQLNSAQFPTSANGSLPVTIKLNNLGFASPFNERKCYIVLKNTISNAVFSIPMATDPRLWLGANEIVITENLTLPNTIPAGNYALYLNLPDASSSIATKPEYAVRFANQSLWDATTGYNNLNHTVSINSTLAVNENKILITAVYPNPTSDKLYVEVANILNYEVSIHNTLGVKLKLKTFKEGNKTIINTLDLNNGVYFLKIKANGILETKKIIINH